jgi:hypothetical protein
MEELIRQAFLHVDVIGPHVMNGHYDLIGPNEEIILPQVWETIIEPDWTITMHMWPMPQPKPVPPPGAPPAMFHGGRPRSRHGHHPFHGGQGPPPPPAGQRSGGGPPPPPMPWLGSSMPTRPDPPGVPINVMPPLGSKHAARRTTSRESTSTTRTRSTSPDKYTAKLEDRLEEDFRKAGLDAKKIFEVIEKSVEGIQKEDSSPDSSPVRDSSTRHTERIVVEECREGSPTGSDEVIVIEKHSPSRKSKESHRSSGFRTVDATAYGGAVDGKRRRGSNQKPTRRPRTKGSSSPAYSPASLSLRSLHWEEELDSEQMEANRAIDEFLGTLVDDDYVSEAGSSSNSGSLLDD